MQPESIADVIDIFPSNLIEINVKEYDVVISELEYCIVFEHVTVSYSIDSPTSFCVYCSRKGILTPFLRIRFLCKLD